MATKTTKKTTKTTKKAAKSKKPNFKEYSFSGKTFEYSGRIYAGRDGSGKIVRRWPMSLCLNGVFTLKGVWLTQTKKNVFLSFPNWYDENAEEWKSYVFLDEEFNEERDSFVNYLCGIVGIDGTEEDDDESEEDDGEFESTSDDDDLPF